MNILSRARELYEQKIKPTIGLTPTVIKLISGTESGGKLVGNIKKELSIGSMGLLSKEDQNTYIKNRYVNPIKNVPSNVKKLVSPSSSISSRTLGLLGTLGGTVAMIPDPVGDIGIPLYDALKGYSVSSSRGGNLRQNLESAKKSFIGETQVGLGDILYKDPRVASLGNLAELPMMLLFAGGLKNKSATDTLSTEFSRLSKLKETGKLTKNLAKRMDEIGAELKKFSQPPIQPTLPNINYPKEYSLSNLNLPKNVSIGPKGTINATQKAHLNDVTRLMKEATNKGIDVPIAKPYEGNVLKDIFNRVGKSVEDFFNSQGTPGKAFTKMHNSARREGDFSAGKATVDLENALKKLTPDENILFADVAEGKIVASTDALREATNMWDSTRKDIANKAEEVGLRIKVGEESIPFTPRENYFPHLVPEEIVKNAQARKDSLVKLVQSGWADNVAQAENKLNQLVKQKMARRYGNLEKSRLLDFPIYEKDPAKVLLNYVDSAYHRIADAKYFGPNDERAYRLANEVALRGGDGELATRMMNRVFGKEDISTFSREASQTLTGVQTVTKLGLGAVRNIGQSANTSLYTNPKITAEAIGDALGNNKESARQFTMLTGEILGSSQKEFLQQVGSDTSITSRFLQKVGFTASEQFNRIVAANAGKRHAQYLTEQLLENPNNNVAIRALKRLDLDPTKILKQGGLALEDEIKAAKNVVENTQFTTQSFDLPYAWTSPAGRVLTQFKSFAYKQTKLIGNIVKNLVSETSKGNFRPLTNVLFNYGVVAPVVGEVLGDVKSIITNKKREEKGLERYLNNVFFAASLGLLEDVGTLATGKYGASGTAGVLAGPTASDIVKGVEAGQSLGRERKTMEGMEEVGARAKPLARFLLGEVPVAGQALKNTLLENQYTRSYIGANREAKTETLRVVEELKKHSPEEQSKMLEGLRGIDNDVYKKVKQLQLEEYLKITEEEVNMKSLGVENGDRARAIMKRLKKMSRDEQNKYYDRLRQLKLLTPEVRGQIYKLAQEGKL